MNFMFDDGGRAQAGYRGSTGDCVCRATAIATELPYAEVYAAIKDAAMLEHRGRVRRSKSSPRTGVHKPTIRRFLTNLGWAYTPTMRIGSGCKVHLCAAELPAGRLIVQVSRHMVAMIDGIVHDTFDPTRNGTRCVYGYWSKL